jgi:hypothetical protein
VALLGELERAKPWHVQAAEDLMACRRQGVRVPLAERHPLAHIPLPLRHARFEKEVP